MAAGKAGSGFGPSIADGEVRYLLEYTHRGKTRTMICPMVNSYERTDEPSTDLEFTLGELPIIEHDGIRQRYITITGSSGYQFRLGRDQEGGQLFASGWDLFMEFQRFIARYLSDAKLAEEDHAKGRDASPSKTGGNHDTGHEKHPHLPRLTFRALHEEDEFLVEPWNFTPRRDVSTSRFTWQYSLTMLAYAPAGKRALNPVEQFFSSATEIARGAAKVVDSATSYVAVASEIVESFAATRAAFLEPVRAVSRLAQQITVAGQAAQQVLAPPTDIIRALADAADSAIEAFGEVVLAAPTAERTDLLSDIYKARAEINRLRMEAVQWLGQQRRKPGATLSTTVRQLTTADNFSVRFGGVRLAEVIDGDSLESIALRETGFVGDAQAIAELNDMRDFQTLSNGAPLIGGAQLLIPSAGGSESALLGGALGDVFGTDALIIDGDLVQSGNDIQTVSGIANYLQALNHRLVTEKGTHGAFPDSYGTVGAVGDPNLAEAPFIRASDMRTQVLADPRTERVKRVSVRVEGDTTIAEVVAVPRQGGTVTLSLPVEV